MDLDNKRVLVVGTGISGISAVKLLLHNKADVILLEGNENADINKIKEKLEENEAVKIIIGELPKEYYDQLDYVVLSPGVPTDLPFVNALRNKEIPIIGEVELAYHFTRGAVAAITGTNGKTTTTTLVGEILQSYYKSVFVVGNIGIPFTAVAEKTEKDTVIAAEVSSFQLETIIEFKPKVSAILNITPDHLNRHHTMVNYIDAKMQIAINQNEEDTCVLNYEDEILRKRSKTLRAKVMYFSSQRQLEEGIYLDEDNNIILAKDGNKEVICNIGQLKLLGKHNYENVMAAIAICIPMGVPMEFIKKVIIEFTAVEHRIEYVTDKKGVKYYNDSKGTNTDAAIQGIRAMTTPTLLIGGGYDKGSEYEEWIKAFDGKVRYLVLMGETREKIEEAAKRCGFQNIILVDDLKEAVEVCAKYARPGDAVLLSPACASWGMFKNYEERGALFKQYVKELQD